MKPTASASTVEMELEVDLDLEDEDASNMLEDEVFVVGVLFNDINAGWLV